MAWIIYRQYLRELSHSQKRQRPKNHWQIAEKWPKQNCSRNWDNRIKSNNILVLPLADFNRFYWKNLSMNGDHCLQCFSNSTIFTHEIMLAKGRVVRKRLHCAYQSYSGCVSDMPKVMSSWRRLKHLVILFAVCSFSFVLFKNRHYLKIHFILLMLLWPHITCFAFRALCVCVSVGTSHRKFIWILPFHHSQQHDLNEWCVYSVEWGCIPESGKLW